MLRSAVQDDRAVGFEAEPDFEVANPPELVEHIALLARRYARAVR